ncbi:MAG: ABC transporter permease [Chitinophagaceae bacterium]|jgi:putative ABC transport system permease protein|nr:ABC transporter permease [Chitinophagaceae bacterium]
MFIYYFKAAWRNIRANRLFSALNIAGLAIGMAICIPLFLFVMEELSFDNMYKNKDNIYRVNLQTIAGGYTSASETWATVPNAVAPAMMKEIPEVKYATRMLKHNFGSPASLKVEQQTFSEKGLYWCDPNIFKVFDISFIYGNPATALSDPNTIVISEAAAQRLFGKQNPVGKIISIDNKYQMQVTGVYKTLPYNSTIDCDMMATFLSSWANKSLVWSNASFETYCLLNKGANINTVNAKLNALENENVPKDKHRFNLQLQPLKNIHLYSADIADSYSAHIGDIKEVRNLALLALLILVIACINYMNLSTAHNEKRAKDIGINKTLGALRSQMIKRVYVETAMIAFFAVLLGYVLSFNSIYLFESVTGKYLISSKLYSAQMLIGIVFLWLLVTLVAGSYPALVLSSFAPITLMKKKISKNLFDVFFRKGLVVLQFTCSIVLIIAVIIVFQQMKFIGKKNLGFTPTGVVSISLSGFQKREQIDALKNNVSSVSGVTNVSGVQAMPGEGGSGRSLYKSTDDNNGLQITTCHSDAQIINTLGLKLIAGTTLPQALSKTDTVIYTILNKQAIDYLGYTSEEAIGKEISVMGFHTKVVITGVVADFNFESLRKPIGAYLYYEGNNAPESVNEILVKFNTGNMPQTMKQLQAAFKNAAPDAAFDYTFLDNYLAALYASEQITSKVSMLFSALAIFVSCLGLFGLAAFTAEQRTKEIGIRKVFGASVSSITKLLTKDFLKLVALSFLIAAPIAWWLMNKWLSRFAYKISVSWQAFAFAGIIAFVIAGITIGGQALKAAMANPAKSIKTE